MSAASPLAQRIQAAMAAKGLTVTGLSRAAGLPHHASLSKLFAGAYQDLGLDTLRKLAAPLGMTLAQMVGDDDAQAPSAPDGGVSLIPLADLRPSPLNPRTHFAPEKLAELADSMAAEGVLQNLTARPAADGTYEVYVGGRRLRAALLLVERGVWPPDQPMPVKVRHATDREVLATATAENVARADMHPLEEGAAFAAMIEAGWSKDDLGRMFGKGARWIELRLQMAAQLQGLARELFATDRINAEMARELARLPRDAQEAHARAIEAGDPGYETARQLHERIRASLPMIGSALFDRALYTGELIEGEHGSASALCADLDQFKRLQRAAIAAKKARLEEQYGWVETRHGSWATFDLAAAGLMQADQYAYVLPDQTGALILVDDAQAVSTICDLIRIADMEEDRARRKAAERQKQARDRAAMLAGHAQAASRPMAPPTHALDLTDQQGATDRQAAAAAAVLDRLPQEITGAQRAWAERTRSQILQREFLAAVTDDTALSDLGVIIACVGMLTTDAAIMLRSPLPAHRRAVHPSVAAAINGAAHDCRITNLMMAIRAESEDGRAPIGDGVAAHIFEALLEAPQRAVKQLFNALVAARIYAGGTTGLGDGPLTIALARTIGLTRAGEDEPIGRDYLDLLSRAQLWRLAATLGMTEAGPHHRLTAPVRPADVRSWDIDKLRETILHFIDANDVRGGPALLGYVSTQEMENDLREEAEAALRGLRQDDPS